jgi:hypothetical protein
MSTVIMTRVEGITPAQYDKLTDLVAWEREVPAGLQAHVASFDGDNLRILEVWDSAEQSEAFFGERVNPALAELALDVRPDRIVAPTHKFFVAE